MLSQGLFVSTMRLTCVFELGLRLKLKLKTNLCKKHRTTTKITRYRLSFGATLFHLGLILMFLSFDDHLKADKLCRVAEDEALNRLAEILALYLG